MNECNKIIPMNQLKEIHKTLTLFYSYIMPVMKINVENEIF